MPPRIDFAALVFTSESMDAILFHDKSSPRKIVAATLTRCPRSNVVATGCCWVLTNSKIISKVELSMSSL
ncbi:hypothetical protein BDA96_04G160400 [Sorghum bicolor]|nr:hypothetical protein BDA96_04G160400 [Sorghum bicolor]KAG0533065.1 hypothetical protein BDA96_04G160400 [Sorghum bicolor]